MTDESCLPRFQAITFKNYSVWMALKKNPALSRCSEQTCLILWEEEDQIDLTWQQKHMDKINLRGSTRFNRLFLLTWIIQDVSSVGGSVWLPDVFSKDFILEPSGGLGSLHRNSPAWCKPRQSFQKVLLSSVWIKLGPQQPSCSEAVLLKCFWKVSMSLCRATFKPDVCNSTYLILCHNLNKWCALQAWSWSPCQLFNSSMVTSCLHTCDCIDTMCVCVYINGRLLGNVPLLFK